MSWEDILKSKFNYDTPQRWFIKTDEFMSALPNELINQLGNDPTEKLARAYKNGLLIDLENNTHYTIENGKITNIAQMRNN
jgi:hypothetical protein